MKLFRLINLAGFMINLTIRICVKIHNTQKFSVTGFAESEEISAEADNMILKCWVSWKITMTENG